jgi:hypothetical protein
VFTGHFAAALTGAGASRRLPLGLLIGAAFGADILEGCVAAFRVNDPTRLWSHSLPATAAIGVLLAAGWRLAGGSWRDAGIVVAVAMSHTALDFVTAVKTIWPGARPAGLNLYGHRYVEPAIEGALCAVGWAIWRASLATERRASTAAWSMLVALLAVQGAALVAVIAGVVHQDWDSLSKFVR